MWVPYIVSYPPHLTDCIHQSTFFFFFFENAKKKENHYSDTYACTFRRTIYYRRERWTNKNFVNLNVGIAKKKSSLPVFLHPLENKNIYAGVKKKFSSYNSGKKYKYGGEIFSFLFFFYFRILLYH